MWSPSRPQRLVAALGAALTLLLLPSTSSADPYPGLPTVQDAPPPFPQDGVRNTAAWLNAPYNGLAGSTSSKQWAPLRLGMLASNISFLTCVHAADAISSNVCPFPTPADLGFYSLYDVSAFLVSPVGAEHPYGEGPVTTVRTVAFGSIPIEVGLQVAQARDSDDLPEPIKLSLSDYNTKNPVTQEIDTYWTNPGTLTARVSVHVTSLSVDGVDINLGTRCATALTTLTATSKAAHVATLDTLSISTRDHTLGFTGGGLSGTLDIPAFSGCTTSSGDDVGPILTSALSGPGNPVSIEYGSTFCGADFNDDGTFKPTPPGDDTPDKGGCYQYQPAPDLNPDLWAVPLRWPIPDYAPGEQPHA